MSLRKSLHNPKTLGSAWAAIFIVFTGLSLIADLFVRRAAAQHNANKPSQITPTPSPTPTSPPVTFTASPIGSPIPETVTSGFDDTPGSFPSGSEIPEIPDNVALALLGAAVIGLGGYVRRRLKDSGSSHSMKRRKNRKRKMAMPALEEIVNIQESAKPKEVNEVLCTVFAPDDIRPGDAFLVQAFAHLAEHARLLGEMAKRTDLSATERGSEKLGLIERTEQLGFYLEMPGLEIDEPQQSLVWNGEIASLKFGVTVPATFEPRRINCKLSIIRHNVPIGHVRFCSRISAAPRAETVGTGLKAYQEFVRYRSAFISYASSDRSEVMKRVQMLDLAKVPYFQDLLSLEAGKQWEPSVYRYIDECDIFYLFWSTAAKKSKWVKKEVQHALKRKGDNLERPPEILAIPIEGPPPVKPPRYLAAIHFDSRFLYFINPKDNNT